MKDLAWLKEEVESFLVPYDDEDYLSYTAGNADVAKLILGLINQLDEPEVLSSDWIKDNQLMWTSIYGVEYYVPANKLYGKVVPEQELPVIPKFVADYIDDRKEVGFPIYQAIRIVRENSRFEHSHLKEWLWTNKGQETFVRAWLDGFTVEKEQKYYVMNNDNRMMLVRMMDGKTITEADPFKLEDMYEVEKKSHRLTEQEIKDYDKRYFAFAVPVEELGE